MKLKKQCIECKTEILFVKSDIKRIPRWKRDKIEKYNKEIYCLLDKRIKTIFGKERNYIKHPWARLELYNKLINAYGVLICPVCKTKQMITNK